MTTEMFEGPDGLLYANPAECADAWAHEATSLRAENEALRKALGEAIEWNWLDDDRPEHLFKMYLAMAREEG